MEKILSVSVACYNLGEMILDNLKSFCESDVANDIELIVTDDGSKDNTVAIVEEYAQKYPNVIKLIKKKNEGPGSTVNSGIQNATGKYFRMVDGDDWVDSNNLIQFVKFLKEYDCDMIISDYAIYDNSTSNISEIKRCSIKSNQVYNIDDVSLQLADQMHAVTYKTKIFQENNIVLDNGFYTDVEYLLYPIKNVKTVAYFDKTIYMYRVGQAGQSVNVNSMKKNINQHDLVLSKLISFYETNKKYMSVGQCEYIKKRLAEMCSTQLGTLLLFEPNKENKLKVISFINLIKSKSVDIYKVFAKSKRCKALVFSNYVLYGVIVKMYLKRYKNN